MLAAYKLIWTQSGMHIGEHCKMDTLANSIHKPFPLLELNGVYFMECAMTFCLGNDLCDCRPIFSSSYINMTLFDYIWYYMINIYIYIWYYLIIYDTIWSIYIYIKYIMNIYNVIYDTIWSIYIYDIFFDYTWYYIYMISIYVYMYVYMILYDYI